MSITRFESARRRAILVSCSPYTQILEQQRLTEHYHMLSDSWPLRYVGDDIVKNYVWRGNYSHSVVTRNMATGLLADIVKAS